MSYKNVTCVCEKKEIKNKQGKRKKSIQKSSPRPAAHHLFGPAQWVCHERRIILYIIPIPYTWRGCVEADHFNQTCVLCWVMTCNMSHVSLNWPSTSPWPGSKCDQSHPASHHLWTNTKSDGPWPDRSSITLVWSEICWILSNDVKWDVL